MKINPIVLTPVFTASFPKFSHAPQASSSVIMRSVCLIVPDVMVMTTVGIIVMSLAVVSECVCSATCIYAKIGDEIVIFS